MVLVFGIKLSLLFVGQSAYTHGVHASANPDGCMTVGHGTGK